MFNFRYMEEEKIYKVFLYFRLKEGREEVWTGPREEAAAKCCWRSVWRGAQQASR